MVQPGSRILSIIANLKREVLTLQKFDGKFTFFWSKVAGKRAKKLHLSQFLACCIASSLSAVKIFIDVKEQRVKAKKNQKNNEN